MDGTWYMCITGNNETNSRIVQPTFLLAILLFH